MEMQQQMTDEESHSAKLQSQVEHCSLQIRDLQREISEKSSAVEDLETQVWMGFLRHYNFRRVNGCQGLRASSLQFTSLLEFNAIFRNGITLRLELNGWSKIHDPVPAKFKHVTDIVTCTLLCCDWITYVLALWNFQKADFEP